MKKEYLTYAFIACLLYLGYGLYGYLFSDDGELGSEKTRLTRVNSDLDQKNKKVKESQEFYRTLETKRGELRQISEQLATMKSTLPEALDVPGVMKIILSEARRVGVNITGITPQPQVKQTYYVEQPFELTFQSVFVQMIAFMDRLSQDQNIMRIDDFTIRPKSTALQSGAKYVELEGTMRIKTYYYLGTREDTLANGSGAPPSGGSK